MGLGISEIVDLSKRIGDLAKAGMTMELQEKIVELRSAILDVKDELITLRQENQALKAEATEKACWADVTKKYVLIEAPGGAMVYRTEESPAHYACPVCFEGQKRRILQDNKVLAGCFSCPECETVFNVAKPRQFAGIGFVV